MRLSSSCFRVLLSLGLAVTLRWMGSGCGGAGTPGSPSMSTSDLEFCVSETNRLRATAGKSPVERSPALEEFAATGAAEDSQSGRPHGHFADTNGGGIAFAENTCPSFGGWTLAFGGGTVRGTIAACLEAFFDEGPGGGHYDNMMGNYKTVGCGWYLDGDAITITQNFGN
jgi:hypothetical protein